jgi:hypothetical protein
MQTPYIHIIAPSNQSPILWPELARTDIVQKERKNNQNEEKNIWDIGQIMRGKKEKIDQVGRSYKNSGRINSNQHQTDGHHRGNDGRWQPATRQFQGYKTNEARM